MTESEPKVTPTQFVAQRMRELRRSRGWSGADLAGALQGLGVGWSRSIVANLESGRRPDVTVTELFALAAAFRISPLALLPSGEWLGADPCACGNVNCAPYWRAVHRKMLEMQIRADRNEAELHMAFLEEIFEERTRAENAELERDAVTARAEQAEAALAELRGRLGALRVERGYGPRPTDVTLASNPAHARDVAERRGEHVWLRIAGEWQPVEPPRTALERAADQQGDGQDGP